MSTRLRIVVEPPSPTGGRTVRVDHEILGVAYGVRDVVEFARRAGLEDVEPTTSELVEWHGGGSEAWQ